MLPISTGIEEDRRNAMETIEGTRLITSQLPDCHTVVGLSNVSFGLPNRRLLNDAFLALAIEAGADSGIVDPTVVSIQRATAADRSSRPFQLALDVLTGADENCRAYMKAHRAGELTASAS